MLTVDLLGSGLFFLSMQSIDVLCFVIEILTEPLNVVSFLLQSHVGVFGQTHTDQFHEMPHWSRFRELQFVQERSEEDVFMEANSLLLLPLPIIVYRILPQLPFLRPPNQLFESIAGSLQIKGVRSELMKLRSEERREK